MCEYDVTVHGRSFSIFLQAFSKSECAANESTVFLDCSCSNTKQLLHTISIAPVSLAPISNKCCSATRMPYTLATLLQNELWSAGLPGVIIDPWILLLDVAPSIIHATAPVACW